MTEKLVHDSSSVVVVLSGGMDSTTLTAHYAAIGRRIIAVSVNYGQRHQREILSASSVAEYYGADHQIVDLRQLGTLLDGSALTDPRVDVPDGHYAEETMRATVVPNRNAILANIAIGIAVAKGAPVVALGMHSGDHFIYPDCRPVFVETLDRLSQVANEGFGAPRIEAPFLNWTKTEVAAYGAQLGAPLEKTWSCYRGGDIHCGTCGTCYERRESFRNAMVADPTQYQDCVTEYAEPRVLH